MNAAGARPCIQSMDSMSTRRRFTGQRAVRILLRTAHIASAAMVLGATTFGGELGHWGALLLFSGGALLWESAWREGPDWIRYVQSWVALTKVALLVLGVLRPEWMLACLWGALVLGSLISHAPGAVRQAALWGEAGPCATRGRATTGSGD